MKKIILEKNLYFFSLLLFLILVINISSIKIGLFGLSLVLLILPGMRLLRKDLVMLFFKTTGITFLLILLTALFFKKVRVLFGIPIIGSAKLVGFAQYFGYPLYYDTYLFIFIICLPLLVIIGMFLKREDEVN